MIADRNLYTDETRTLLLEEGDARSNFYIAREGLPVDQQTAERWNLRIIGGRLERNVPTVPAETSHTGSEAKAVSAPPENKAVKAPKTKRSRKR